MTYAVAMLLFSLVGLRCRSTRCSACRACCRSTRRPVGGRAEPRLQHGGQLHHQHQLAVLRARDDDELSRRRWPGSPCRTSSRRRPASRWRSRWCAASRAARRRRIGNFWVDLTRCTLYILLPISIVVGAVLRLAGHAAEPRRLHRGDDARRRQAGDRPGAGRLAGGHQDARHQRRRLLQRQLGPSVREPDAAHQPRRDAC